MKRMILYFLLLVNLQALFSMDDPEPFQPTVEITERSEQDEALLRRITQNNLFFETRKNRLPPGATPYDSAQPVGDNLVKHYGAQRLELTTQDNFRISAIYVKRENAPINIIYLTGYFHNYTPPKEWCAPLVEIFPNYNIFMFDWRSIGQSEGERRLFRQNAFGPDAYLDVQVAIDYVRADNDRPIVLHGFCFGGAMAMHATLTALANNLDRADALGFSCLFTRFENLFNRAYLNARDWFPWLLLKLGIGKPLFNYMMSGDMFSINPIEMISLISEQNIPCWFDHYVQDPFAILEEGIEVYRAGARENWFFLQSNQGRHARLHIGAPFQYQQAYNKFLCGVDLLEEIANAPAHAQEERSEE